MPLTLYDMKTASLGTPATSDTILFGAVGGQTDTEPVPIDIDVIDTYLAQTSKVLTNKTLTAADINAGTADSLTSLSVRSTGAAFDLLFATAEAISANRTLSWVLGNAARTITLSGNPTLSDWFDQSVKAAATPTFGGVTSPTLTGGTGVGSTLTLKSTSGVGATDAIIFQVGNNGGTEAGRILTSGFVGFGTATPLTLLDISADAANVVSTVHASTDTAGQRGQFFTRRSRTTRASPTIVQDNDSLGSFLCAAYDGSAYLNVAEVIAEVDGTPGANDMPTRLIFKTTPNGSATRVERMRIDNAGNVTLAGAGTIAGSVATIDGTQELDNKTLDSAVGKGTWTASGTWTLPAFTAGGIITLGAAIAGGGQQLNNVIIGTSTPLAGSFTTLGATGLVDISGAAAGQIKFPAGDNASADANTLDDYQEGTWAPTLAFGGASVNLTYTTQLGWYTKIGNVVNFWIFVVVNSNGDSTGSATITNLPFSASATANRYTACNGSISSGTAIGALCPFITPGTAIISLFSQLFATLDQTTVLDAANIMIAGNYIV